MSSLAFAASSSTSAAQRAPVGPSQGVSLRSSAVTEAPAAAAPASGVFEAALPLGLAGVGAAVLSGLRAKRATRPALASAVALKAFENELGVQPPTGFWDPAGFCSDGDAKEFYRRRCVEIKHGRVSMLACLGYIVPEYFKFPGYCSMTSGIKFADIGTGLSALLKVPAVGWIQWVFFCGYMELFAAYQDPELIPGKLSSRFVVGLTTIKSNNLSGWVFGPFGVPNAPSIADPELRKKKLNAEIANGRLAMMAIIGMFFQDGLTGSAWGDWALYTDSPLRAYENEAGVQAPVGFWDPLGLSASGSNFDYKRRREVELKHGRVCMFATIGYIVPEYTRLPGDLSPSYGVSFADVPNGLAALSKVPALGWCQIVAFAGLVELNIYNEQINGEPGNYGAGFLGIRSIGLMSPGFKDPETRKKKLNAELANGRLAMMATIGMFFQDGLTGSAWGDWALYTDSPLRAFENELGVQAPTGFWDPVGFTKDGDVEKFKRRRVTEIKHGRVAMLATMGYITPEITGKFPGYLSPAAGLKFEDIPNGLAAISKVPGAGWVQIVLYALFCESTGGFGYNSDGQRSDPGNCGWRPPLLATDDADLRRKRLNAELANGRLAMMAIIGMFFQDGLTGSAWGDWANFTASPLRAFENELGVQAPVGFFDPLGFCKDGDVDVFKRRREVELKHGRVAMFATMGYIVPEYFRFPGDLSPSLGLTFAEVPNGLEAISKVPALGWVQWFIFCGLVDFGLYRADPSRDPGDYENAGILGVPNASGPMQDAEGRKRKLNSELANGRLAMVAIMGMLFQNGTFGTTAEMWAFGS